MAVGVSVIMPNYCNYGLPQKLLDSAMVIGERFQERMSEKLEAEV